MLCYSNWPLLWSNKTPITYHMNTNPTTSSAKVKVAEGARFAGTEGTAVLPYPGSKTYQMWVPSANDWVYYSPEQLIVIQ